MDGFAPVTERLPAEPSPGRPVAPGFLIHASRAPWWAKLKPWAPFLLTVVAPTLATAGFYYGVVANQYQSEAHFIVRTNASQPPASAGIGALLGVGAPSGGSEARSVEDYLTSHDAVEALGLKVDLVGVFRRPESDWFTRLHGADRPAPETLLHYYRGQVKVTIGSDSGIATLTVRAFRPRDAEAVAQTLLDLGEARVNTFNQRALDNSLSVARAQLRDAEAGVAQAEGSVTGLRLSARDIDPERNSTAQISLATGLQQKLAESRAALASMSQSISADSPQRVALTNQVRALEQQVGGVQAHMAGSGGTAMAPTLGVYESVRLRQEFAAKRYEAAAAALAAARTEALKQQMFVVRVVEPNLPVKALYPQRFRIVATVFCGLLLAYAIGWLVFAGVREHAA